MSRAIYVEPTNVLPSTIDYIYGQAAEGPDYGVASTANLRMVRPGYSGFVPSQVKQVPANYGLDGPIDNRSNIWIDNALLPGVALGPLNSPTYNVATPQGFFHLKVDNAEQYARWQVTQGNVSIPNPIPVDYNAAAAVTLYGGK